MSRRQRSDRDPNDETSASAERGSVAVSFERGSALGGGNADLATHPGKRPSLGLSWRVMLAQSLSVHDRCCGKSRPQEPSVASRLIWHLLDAVVADPHVMNSSPRRAFCFNASSERWRSSDSSISLMVPFMPSRRRSLGWRGSKMQILVDDQRADEAAERQERVPVAAIACET